MARVPQMTVAHEVRSIAGLLIREHHEHLTDANMLYVFTDQRRKRCDRVRLGSASKLTALQRFLSSGMDSVDLGADFIILVDSNLWVGLRDAARAALVDHELCHAAVFVKDTTEKPAFWRRLNRTESKDDFTEWRWGMRGHDIEEFGEVLYRHGFWKPDGPERAFGEIVAMQMKLMPDEEPNGSAEVSNGLRRHGTRSSEHAEV